MEQFDRGNFKEVNKAWNGALEKAIDELPLKELSIIKALMTEALILLSRAAVKGGADDFKISCLNSINLDVLFRKNSFEGVMKCYLAAVDDIIAEVRYVVQARNALVNRAVSLMGEDYAQNLTVQAIAKKVFLSPSHFSRLFKKETGMTVMEYLTLIRLERAKQLLKEQEERPVCDVARQVGFNDPQYFSRLFKKTQGLTPTDYRKKTQVSVNYS